MFAFFYEYEVHYRMQRIHELRHGRSSWSPRGRAAVDREPGETWLRRLGRLLGVMGPGAAKVAHAAPPREPAVAAPEASR